MADERCVYENVHRDASSLCVDIFVKLQTILSETFDQRNLLEKRTVEKLFSWVALNAEVHVRHCFNLKFDIANIIKNRACEHGARYKDCADWDDFWDEKRLRALKEAGRKTEHRHLPIEGHLIVRFLDECKTWAKKRIKELRE